MKFMFMLHNIGSPGVPLDPPVMNIGILLGLMIYRFTEFIR